MIYFELPNEVVNLKFTLPLWWTFFILSQGMCGIQMDLPSVFHYLFLVCFP